MQRENEKSVDWDVMFVLRAFFEPKVDTSDCERYFLLFQLGAFFLHMWIS